MTDAADDTIVQSAPHLFVATANVAGWRALAAADRAAHSTRYAAQLHDALAHLHAATRRPHGRISLAACVVSDTDAASLRLVLHVAAAAIPPPGVSAFTPPEALASGAAASIPGDIYSYGCVLYWLANGVEPFARFSGRSNGNALRHAVAKQTAAKAMPLLDTMPMFAEIRAATRHKPLKRALLRPAIVDAEPTAAAAAAPLATPTFKQRAANRQSRVVIPAAGDAAAAASARAARARQQRGTLRTLRRTSRGDDEAAAFAALFGDDARTLLALVVAERAQEGIFRVPGDADDIDAFAAGRKPLADLRNVHTAASLLKRAFREHSPALVADAADREARELLQLAEQAAAAAADDAVENETADELVDQLAALLRAHCSDTQRLALRHLARALHALVAAERDNKMSLDALLTCIGPSFHCAPGWLKWAILRFDRLFRKE
jgi:hypothetical protein